MREDITALVKNMMFHQFPYQIFEKAVILQLLIMKTVMMLLQKTMIQRMRLVYATLSVVLFECTVIVSTTVHLYTFVTMVALG